MKNTAFIAILCMLAISLGGGWTVKDRTPVPTEDKDKEIKARVAAIMEKMDLADKVGEMTQLTLDMLSVGEPFNLASPHQLDSAKLRKALVELRVGSILNIGASEYTVEHWNEIIRTIQRIATTEKASGIPVIYGIDAIHGTNFTTGANLHPQQLGMAASFNPAMAEELAEMTAYQTRASHIPWTFSPVMDLGRDPRWSRIWETFGEDVHLVTQMGVAMVKGFEGDDISNDYRVASCLKHFLGYSSPLRGKDRTQAWIPERQLREYFLPSFQAAVDAGASTIMICSGEMNGIPVHNNEKILTDILRKEMGFEGLAVTDWNDINFLYQRHRTAKDYKEAIKQAINAGIDMSMVPADLEFPVLLKELVEEGEIPISRIDEAVERILTVKVRLGLFENPYPKAEYPDFGGEKYSQLCLEAAQQSVILAKNEKNILPLAKNKKILVTGPTANSMIPLNGGWTHTWQGDDASRQTKGKKNILQAIQAKIGESNVRYVPGTKIVNKVDSEIDIKAAVRAAKKVDVIVLCLGEFSYTEGMGDMNDLNLPMPQQKLVKALAATGKPMVAVMTEGRPRIISAIEPELDGILVSFLLGDEGGLAIADVLFGDVNPSGKFPITYPRFANDLVTYDHKGTDEIGGPFGFNPQFEFGSGLSYTSFEYSKLKLNRSVYRKNDPIEISVNLKNTGSRTGTEVVQVFVKDHVASITPPVKRLRAFKRVELENEFEEVLTFTIMPSELSFVGRDNKWVLEPGKFSVMVGDQKVDFELK
ncbi:MAG: glycoside hydrolase family 3 C-terminal domain-containing protein [Bacteroidia bacterium]|nr:glycoside hydrolase family 3 C-terminal domain-containing protein [Bacteroidia bacterium]